VEERLAQLAASGKAKQTPAPARSGADLSEAVASKADKAAAEERLALRRELLRVQDHLAEIESRLRRLQPFIQAGTLLRSTLRLALGIFRFALGAAVLILHLGATLRRIDDARFRSERLTFDSARNVWTRRLDFRAFAGCLRRSFGIFHPALYRIRPRQRLCLAQRPKVLHAIANVWVGGSTQLVVDLHGYLGHRIEMEVVTSSLPSHGSHQGMTIRVAPQPASRHLVRSIFTRFQPHIVHVHYWGDVDEPWYRVIFEIAAEFGCQIVQNVNTPVVPFADAGIARNVFVSESVLDRFGSTVPAEVIYPGVNLEDFAPPATEDGDAFDAIGMIYRLENDKLNADAIELLIAIVKRRPNTRAIIVGDGSLFGHFRARVEQEGLLSRFEFTGFVPYEDLPAHLARFKTFVAPVRQESFGQVIPFAMCAGRAVAGYRVGAVPEILGSVETLGESLDETANIVLALLDDRDRMIALGEHNRAIALKRFSVEKMAISYFNLYRGLAPRDFDVLRDLPDAINFPL
jgi:glycosyltransferase involved in cell wall biosynthesis